MKLLKKFFSPFILAISSFLIIYIIYKSEFYWDGNNRKYYLIYFVVCFLLFIFSIISFFLNQMIKEYIIIFFLSIVLSLYFFEGYLIYNKQVSKELLYQKKTGKKWDKRQLFEIFNDLKKINDKISIPVFPSTYLRNDHFRNSDEKNKLFQLSGLSNSKTIYCNENGYYSVYESDKYGFNNPNYEWKKEEIDLILIGDSFIHGACVNKPHDIGSVLRNKFNKSVLNLGYGGNGPLIEYAILREYLQSNHKKVIWFYYEDNDLRDLFYEKKNKILNKYLTDLSFTQNLKFKQDKIDSKIIEIINRVIKKKEEEKKLLTINSKFLKLYNTRLFLKLRFTKSTIHQASSTSEFKQVLRLAKNFVQDNESEFYFVYLPKYTRFSKNYDSKNLHLESIKKVVLELEIPFLDISKEVFEKEKNPLSLFPFKKSGHYTIEGYQKVSEAIYKFLN